MTIKHNYSENTESNAEKIERLRNELEILTSKNKTTAMSQEEQKRIWERTAKDSELTARAINMTNELKRRAIANFIYKNPPIIAISDSDELLPNWQLIRPKKSKKSKISEKIGNLLPYWQETRTDGIVKIWNYVEQSGRYRMELF